MEDTYIQAGTAILAKSKGFKGLSYASYNELCDLQVNSLIKDKKITCEVCAKGALFMAHVNKTNHLVASELNSELDNEAIVKRLLKCFSQKQLDLIETAFERDVINDDSHSLIEKLGHYTEEARRAMDFANNCITNNEILIEICKNIIKNKGTFIP